MNKERLIKNMVDQVKEAQLKLGYARETVRLYYPLSSLNALLETELTDVNEMRRELCGLFPEAREDLGALEFRIHAGRVEVSIPPEGAAYIHESVETPAFLAALIRLFQEKHHCTLADIREVFSRFTTEYVCEKMPEGSDFDYVMYFRDPSIDEYYYCIKEEMGHTIYHRFMEADYRAL